MPITCSVVSPKCQNTCGMFALPLNKVYESDLALSTKMRVRERDIERDSERNKERGWERKGEISRERQR